MRRPDTLRARLAWWVAGLLLAALLVFSIAIYAVLAHSLYASVDRVLRLTAAQAGQNLQADTSRAGSIAQVALPGDETPGPDWQTAGITVHRDTPEGRLIRVAGAERDLTGAATGLAQARGGRAIIENLPPAGDAGALRVYTGPVLAGDRMVGLVQVAHSLSDLQATLARLALVLLASVPLLVVFAGIGGYQVAARSLAPVDQIIATAQRVASHGPAARQDLPDAPGELGRLAGALNRMLARLDESLSRERQFAGDASHELRTPLAAMRTILASVRERRRSVAEYEEALADLSDETERLQGLVENLLLLARNDSARATHSDLVDLSTTVCDVVDSLSPQAEAKGLYLRCRAVRGLRLLGDGDGVIRLLVNLLDNAIKYTERGGITVHTGRGKERHTLKITIADTGIGISPEQLPHIFDRFYRADAARSAHGAGLGLAIAGDIAAAHGGRIEVTSTAGAGTIFSVILRDRGRGRRIWKKR